MICRIVLITRFNQEISAFTTLPSTECIEFKLVNSMHYTEQSVAKDTALSVTSTSTTRILVVIYSWDLSNSLLLHIFSVIAQL